MELREDHGAVIQQRLLPRPWALPGVDPVREGDKERSGQIRAVGCCSLSDLSNSFLAGGYNLHGGGVERGVD